MCEANAYWNHDTGKELIMEAVDLVEALPEGGWRLVNIFGEQQMVDAGIDHMSLADHKIYFRKAG